MGFKKVNKHFDFNEKDISEEKYDAWELIQPLWYNVNIYDSIEEYNKDLEPFSDGQRKMLALLWYDSEVNNGGHDQFFSNSTGIVWKDAIECMKMIGAVEYAENFQKAIDMFGEAVPFDRNERNEILERLNEDKDFDDFEQNDSFYYEEGMIYQLMNDYVKGHASDFVVNGDYLYYEMD